MLSYSLRYNTDNANIIHASIKLLLICHCAHKDDTGTRQQNIYITLKSKNMN